MLHFSWNFCQNHQQTKIYTTRHMDLRIVKVEKLTSWRAGYGFALFSTCNYPDHFQSACRDDWWRIGSLETCKSSLIWNCHEHLQALVCMILSRKSPMARSISLKTSPGSRIMQEKWGLCEDTWSSLWEKIWIKIPNLDLKMCVLFNSVVIKLIYALLIILKSWLGQS